MANRQPVPFLHLIDGEGAIAPPADISRYLARSLGADVLPVATPPPTGFGSNRGRGAPSIPALRDRGFHYRVVGVFGGQSSGKSTLLNHLFSTKFETMNQDDGRTQTTKGCFMGKAVTAASSAASTDLYVLDFEGTDGVERGENQSFEKQLSLFALSVADTLIVNMWSNEVGRFNAANLSLLQTVFEVNLQLMAHERSADMAPSAKPTLLFVLRDHTAGPLEKLRDGIIKSLATIWDRIGKPPVFAERKIDDFFHLCFCALPHYVLQREQFDEAVDDFRSWFCEPQHPRYLYHEVGADNYRHIALDDVGDYLNSCWSSIKTMKDLDIPTQREMLALVRCAEVMDQLCSEHEADIKRRVQRAKEGAFIPNVTSWLAANVRQRIAVFERETSHYATAVTKPQAVELQKRLEAAGRTLVDTQCSLLCDALVRANDDKLQGVMDMAINSVLPRLATEWFEKIEAARSAAASQADKAGDDAASKAGRVAEAQKKTKISNAVNKFWDFIAVELMAVSDHVRDAIAATAGHGSASGRSTPTEPAAEATTPLTDQGQSSRLLQCLKGDSSSITRTLTLVRGAMRARVVERLQFLSSDLSSSMTKAFERHLGKNADGTVRFLTTLKGLNRAFGPARAAGLLLAACIMVYRVPEADASSDAAAQSLLDRWCRDAMHLDFTIDEDVAALIGAPIYPAPPAVPAFTSLQVVRNDNNDDDDGAASDEPSVRDVDPGTLALRALNARVLVDQARLGRAFDMFNQHCTFTYKMQCKQIEAGTNNTPTWVWGLLLLLGANEAWWLVTNPLLLIFLGAVIWFFFRSWVEAQWSKFEETAPSTVVLPVKGALAYAQSLYSAYAAPTKKAKKD